MADSVEQLYKAQDLQEKLYPITKENAVKDNSNVSLDTKLTSINTSISNKVDKVTGKGLSTNDYTSAEKTKLAGIEDGAQVNIIESIELNGESQPIENKTAKIDISSVLENLTSGSSLKLYAQETLADQEFLYRESPTQEDGYAKIKNLYGNTLVWNQLVQNGNFADSSNWVAEGEATINSITNNTINVTTASTGHSGLAQISFPMISGHKYLLVATIKTTGQTNISVSGLGSVLFNTNSFVTKSGVFTWTASTGNYWSVRIRNFDANSAMFEARNVMLFDLTQMGLDITDPSEFTSLFSKPYYDYCQGAMLSFGGRNVKFNQVAPSMSSSMWVANRCTKTVSGNTFSLVGTEATQGSFGVYISLPNLKLKVNHNYLFMCVVNPNRGIQVRFTFDRDGRYTTITPNQDNVYSRVVSTATEDPVVCYINHPSSITTSDTVTVKNLMIVDLTEMFGAGNEPSAEGFKELFPNDYYEYTTGKYMNIGQPVSLKTVGKNLWKYTDSLYKRYCALNNQDGTITVSATGADCYFGDVVAAGLNYSVEKGWLIDVSKIKNLAIRTGNPLFWKNYITRYDSNKVSLGFQAFTSDVFTADVSNCTYVSFRFGYANSVSGTDYTIKPQVEIGTQSTDFEPYAESTLSIPLDEFPDGMDGINDVKDEKNETGYKKKIGFVVVDGSDDEYWGFQSGTPNQCYHRMVVSTNLNNPPSISNYANRVTMYSSLTGISYIIYSGELRISDMNGAITDVASLRAWLQAHPLVVAYALQEPLENYSVVDLGTLNWHTGGTNTSGIVRMGSSDLRSVIKKPSAGNVPAKILCNIYETKSADNTYTKNGAISLDTAGDVLVYDSNYNTSDKVSAFKQAMSGVYLLYEKENPQGFTTEMRYPAYVGGTEQILPENVSIPTTAPIVADIEYSYDFKAVDRIIGMLNSVAQNETSPSTHNYSVGDYLVYNYQLYKVIASISTGASLTVGTNIQATTIMNELASLS